MKIADEAGESASIAAVSVSPVPNRIRPIVTVVCHKSDTPARNSLIERIEALGKKYCAQISDVPPPSYVAGNQGIVRESLKDGGEICRKWLAGQFKIAGIVDLR